MRTRTRPCGASSTAARRPAMPLPIMRKSAETRAITRPAILAGPRLGTPCHVRATWIMDPIRLTVTSERTHLPGRHRLWRDHAILRALLSRTRNRPPAARRQQHRRSGAFRAAGSRGARPKAGPTLIPDGERAKTLATVATLYDACVHRGLDRSAAIIAFGGGVVGDVAGFAAATYLRGIKLGPDSDDAAGPGG